MLTESEQYEFEMLLEILDNLYPHHDRAHDDQALWNRLDELGKRLRK